MVNSPLITWIDNKTTVYDANELKHLKKGISGFAMSYYNPHSGRYEQPRAVQPIEGSIKERIAVRSAAVASRKARREQEEAQNKKLPAHLRLHQIYGL